jgi:hypothetical protein
MELALVVVVVLVPLLVGLLVWALARQEQE